ncbi:protein farnesyltransferase subunit beta [Folsomia candida]|uniref:protein farnesyltransferase subunit beta n=1 Tax=Folsomia candida TaxID=158441 RepID=UPI000B8FD845|nr:protein farnesyltransferase subunit beta [Folsomia candida]
MDRPSENLDDDDMEEEEFNLFVGTRRSISALRISSSTSDGFFSDTFDEQNEVENGLLAIYQAFAEKPGSSRCKQIPILLREKHTTFLRRGLKRLSDAYEALDASRPWLCYWILHSMNLLSIKVSKEEALNISQFLSTCQDNHYGGFGGGPGQLSHLAATYAAINALVSLDIPEALSIVDRPSLLRFLKSMKRKDGSFQMHRGGEIDVRAVYCAVVVASLTNLCSEEDLFVGTSEWIVRCQTYEGGFAGFIGGEAHGGYTFCAAAALVLLKGDNLMDRNSLLRWLVGRQLSLEGGFQGRTNKLVDGCYSFWQGACFCLLGENYVGHNTKEGPHWLFDQLSLQEYILICCQHPAGGLIDKPGKPRDYYHTCYTLSGLAISQHAPGYSKVFLENKQNELKQISHVYNLTKDVVEHSRAYFYGSDDDSSSAQIAEIVEVEATKT